MHSLEHSSREVEPSKDRDEEIRRLALGMSAEERLQYAKQNGWTLHKTGFVWTANRKVDRQDFQGMKSSMKTIGMATKRMFEREPKTVDERPLFEINPGKFEFSDEEQAILAKSKALSDSFFRNIRKLGSRSKDLQQKARERSNKDCIIVLEGMQLNLISMIWHNNDIEDVVYQAHIDGKSLDPHVIEQKLEQLKQLNKRDLDRLQIMSERLKSIETTLQDASEGPYR